MMREASLLDSRSTLGEKYLLRMSGFTAGTEISSRFSSTFAGVQENLKAPMQPNFCCKDYLSISFSPRLVFKKKQKKNEAYFYNLVNLGPKHAVKP